MRPGYEGHTLELGMGSGFWVWGVWREWGDGRMEEENENTKRSRFEVWGWKPEARDVKNEAWG